MSGVRVKGKIRGPIAIIWTWRILRFIKRCVGKGVFRNSGSVQRMHSYVEWIGENIGAESPKDRTPLEVS